MTLGAVREFSYEELIEILYIEEIPFIIRLMGDKHKQPHLVDAEGEPSSCSSGLGKP